MYAESFKQCKRIQTGNRPYMKTNAKLESRYQWVLITADRKIRAVCDQRLVGGSIL